MEVPLHTREDECQLNGWHSRNVIRQAQTESHKDDEDGRQASRQAGKYNLKERTHLHKITCSLKQKIVIVEN
jgi:hypothetical protein